MGLAILQPGSHVTICGALCLKREGSLTAPPPVSLWHRGMHVVAVLHVCFFEERLFQFWLWPNTKQLTANIWGWNSFKQRPAAKPGCCNPAVWIMTFTEATTKLFVRCMVRWVWQHEWEAARSDQGWTSHLTSKMKGKIGHYRGCIQTTKHNSTFA